RLLFFFPAEDGIRDFHVTGVQTCALPISTKNPWPFPRTRSCCGRAARTLSVVPHRCKSSPALLFRESQAEMPGFFVFLLDSVWSVAQFKKIMEFFYIKTVVSWTLCLCLISILASRARVA